MYKDGNIGVSQEQKELEMKIMDLNKKAMEHLGREQLHGYGVIDETCWQEEMKRLEKPTIELPGSNLTPRRGGATSHQISVVEKSRKTPDDFNAGMSQSSQVQDFYKSQVTERFQTSI